MENDQKSAFQQDVHNFRAFAIVGVVGAHALHNFTWSPGSAVFVVLDTLFNQSTIWFAFIAGYLFQHLSSSYRAPSYYSKKFKNVFVPYLICSIPAIAASFTFHDQPMPANFEEHSIPIQALLFVLTGKHLAPYWYIPMIMIIFFLAPALIALDRRPGFYLSLMPLLVLSAYLGRDGFLVHSGLSGYFGQVSKAIYLISPYLLGMFVSHFYSRVMAFMSSFWLPLLLISLMFFLLEVRNYHQTTYFIFLFKVTSAPVILYLINRRFGVFQSSIDRVAALSFGIFFLHGYVLSGMKLIVAAVSGLDGQFTGSIFGYSAFVAFVVTASLLAIGAVRRLAGRRSRYVIGC